MAEPASTPFSRSVDSAVEFGDKAAAAVRDAKAGFDDTVEDLSQKGREAVEGVRDVWSALGNALADSIRTRPYTTLAGAALVGFLYGALRSR